jgi:hypothetical protein
LNAREELKWWETLSIDILKSKYQSNV